MTARCCRASAPILPVALAFLLPKCPLCLAAWLTVTTGIGFTAAAAGWLHWAILVVSGMGIFAALGRTVQRFVRLRHRKHLANPLTIMTAASPR